MVEMRSDSTDVIAKEYMLARHVSVAKTLHVAVRGYCGWGVKT